MVSLNFIIQDLSSEAEDVTTVNFYNLQKQVS